eukprot:3783824-Pleurochrysis_carterae.AAC.1
MRARCKGRGEGVRECICARQSSAGCKIQKSVLSKLYARLKEAKTPLDTAIDPTSAMATVTATDTNAVTATDATA